MMQYATVDPNDSANISDVDLDGREMFDGSSVRIPDYQGGERRFTIAAGAVPDFHLYDLEIVDPGYPGPVAYYTRSASLAFIVSPPSVRKTWTYNQIPIGSLYATKNQENTSHSNLVFNSAFSHTAGPLEFWAPSDQLALDSRQNYCDYLSTRFGDIFWDAVRLGIADPGGINSEIATWWNHLKAVEADPQDMYWQRDIRVFLYDKETLELVRDAANENQWTDLMLSQGTFTHQVRAATDRVRQDIDAAYAQGNGDWQTLADILTGAPGDAFYNWPEYYVGDLSGG